MIKTKVHVTTGKHWALDVERVSCPECTATPGFPCISRQGAKGRPTLRYPNNTVHAMRVRAAGHSVRVY
jgi:hypothetical protein